MKEIKIDRIMLKENEKEKILVGVRKILPEYKEMLKTKRKLENLITEKSLGVLNEEEKLLIDKYPNLVRYQPSISINGHEIYRIETQKENIELANEIRDNLIPNSQYFESYSLYMRDWLFNEALLFEKVPKLFDTWNELMVDYPDIYVEIRDVLIQGLRYRKAVVDKLTKLRTFLDNHYVNLTYLKKNFTELYKMLKG